MVRQILVATTGGFVLSVLRPRWSRALNWAVLATLFVPAVVLLVPLYRIIVDPPIGPSLINNYLAVWLPAGASAFNVVLVARFFDSLPREIFEAARMDGAGPFRLFWSIVLPMSRPIIGVVSVFAVIASWKDFLWPFLVLKSDSVKPLSVYLQSMANVDKGTLMAALAISTAHPDRDVPGVPADVPARRRTRRSGQGLAQAAPTSQTGRGRRPAPHGRLAGPVHREHPVKGRVLQPKTCSPCASMSPGLGGCRRRCARTVPGGS